MRKRKLGRSGIEVSELGLGTWGLSGDAYGPVPPEEQDAVIERALALGITLFETADIYAKGEMEKRLKDRLPKDDAIVVVTKWGTDLSSKPARKRFDSKFLTESFARSQERLGRERLDIGLLHNPSVSALRDGEGPRLLQQWVDHGKLRAWGLSAGDPEVVRAALALPNPPGVVELAFNVFLPQDVRTLGEELYAAGVGLLARSVLAHGLLAGHWPADKTFPPEDHRSQRWTRDQLRRRVHQLKALRTLHSAQLPSQRAAALAFVLDNDLVSSAVLGPRNVIQLDQLIREVPKQPPYLDDRARQALDAQLSRMNAP